MRFQGQLLRLLSFINFICLLRAKKVCDVRVWYLNMINDDVFSVDLTDDQLRLKNTIESLVMKASESRDTRMLECSTLYLYDDMLKDLFNYSPTGSGMELKEVEDGDASEKIESVSADPSYTDISSNKMDIPNKVKKEETDESSKNENADDTEENSDNDLLNTPTDKIERIVDTDDSEVEDESSDGTDKVNYFQSDNNGDLSMEGDQLDETEYLDDSDPDLSISDDLVESNENYLNVLHADKESDSDINENQAGIEQTNTIPFGVCYSFGCFISDIFNVYSSQGINNVIGDVKRKTIPLANRRNRKFRLKCPIKPSCSLHCFYQFLLSKSFCMIGYINNAVISLENNEHNKNGNIENSQNEKDDLSEHGTIDAINAKIKYQTHSPKMNDDSRKKTDIPGDMDMNLVEKDEISLTEFERIIEQKTRKYYSKIQNLEVMIIKLENQLLMAALNKQNHSSTITKLENQILKFENELLRMNKNYQYLKAETENTSKRQHKYLELAYKQIKKEYPKLPDKSSQKYELIAQHQTKINELADLLRNQSSTIMQLQKKHDHLEEQNKMLHEMVMNQTIFMNSIVKTVQDLSEQNIKNQNEISALRLNVVRNSDAVSIEKKVKLKPGGDQGIIDELDTLLFNNPVEKSSSIKKDEVESKSKVNKDGSNELKLESYNNKKSEKSTVTSWCQRDTKTCSFSDYSPYVNSHCLPYSNVFWADLKTLKMEEHNVEEKDYPTIPDVIDDLPKTEYTFNQKEEQIFHKVNKVDQNEEKVCDEAAEEVKITVDKDKVTDAKYDKDFSKYILVGYDRDGKPVLKARENLESVETTPGSMLENNKVETETKTKPSNIQNNEESTLDKSDIKKEQMSEKHTEVKNGDSKYVQGHAETLNTHKQVSNEPERNQDEELKDTNSQQNKVIDNYKNSKESNENAERGKISKITSQEKDNDSIIDSSVNEENKKNISKIDHKENKVTSKDNEANEQEIIKKNKVQHDIKDAKKVETNAKDEDRKKIKQTESKLKERKSPIHIDRMKQNEPKDCYDIYLKGEKRDGLYKVNPLGSDKQIQVFCDMRRGGWTVIQRRQDGSTNFFQEWNDYKKGFGGLYGEHWLGNDNIHYLTNQDFYKLRVDLMDWEKTKKFAEFDYFLVDSEEESYKLHVDGYTGDAGDGLTKHDGSKFSTKDVDNDKVVKEFGGSCAKRFYGAGWYYKCYASNLNGKFYKGGKIPEKKFDGITWKPWTGPNYSLKKVEMKIRPASAKN